MSSYLVTFVLPGVAPLVDKVPKDNDVKAGWGAFGLFLLMAVAVAALGYFLNRQLKTTARNAEAGAFGPVDPGDSTGVGPGSPTSRSTDSPDDPQR